VSVQNFTLDESVLPAEGANENATTDDGFIPPEMPPISEMGPEMSPEDIASENSSVVVMPPSNISVPISNEDFKVFYYFRVDYNDANPIKAQN